MLAHEVLDLKNTLPHVQIPSFIILLHCKYYIMNIPSFCDLGVIIPIGRDGLCETSMRH
jgi:hypothetical protein